MKFKAFIAFFLLLMFSNYCESKGGRGGFSSRGGGFSSRGKASSGSSWFSSSKPASSPSYRPSPSYSGSPSSYNSPSAPSYGWNVNKPSPSSGSSFSNTANSKPIGWNFGNTQTASKPAGSSNIGWNVGNTGSKPAGSQNIGWNVGGSGSAAKPSAPVGPPPAYPGLSNRPVSGGISPPAYSPSFSNPPAYNPSYNSRPSYNSPSYSPSYNSRPSYSPSYPSNNYNRQYNYNTGSYQPGYNSYPSSYGSTFGHGGLGSNTYIHNNYYGGSRSGGGSGFLTNALFYGVGMHHGYMWGGSSSRRNWDSEDDRRWRATTKAPYFENKVPGSESYLPAAAVVGAATAFGLTSLLPLNVPSSKPLMYCNNTEITQTQIKLEDNIYSCVNNSIAMSCPRSLENATIIDACVNKIMECDLKDSLENLFCTNATLVSRSGTLCNSTIVLNGTNVNETTTILDCYPGLLADKLTAFIPTTTTEAPLVTTTEKNLSLGAKIHVFFLKLIGKSDVLKKETTTVAAIIEDDPRLGLKENETAWVPEALTIPPETTTTEAPTSTTEPPSTTTEGPYMLAMKMPKQLPNGTFVDGHIELGDSYSKLLKSLEEGPFSITMPPYVFKIPITSTPTPETDETTDKIDLTETTTTNASAPIEPLSEI